MTNKTLTCIIYYLKINQDIVKKNEKRKRVIYGTHMMAKFYWMGKKFPK
jgi:hypothetical protein